MGLYGRSNSTNSGELFSGVRGAGVKTNGSESLAAGERREFEVMGEVLLLMMVSERAGEVNTID